MRVLIGADVVPVNDNIILFENGNIEKLLNKELRKKLKSADFRIFNLETPLTNNSTPIQKCGPNLIASTKSIIGIKLINPDFFTLANNHIMDQGEEGIVSTIKVLEDNNISFAGAGKNIQTAREPFIIKKDGIRLGIYCCTEHEFSIAAENKCGANPFDPLECFDDVYNLKKKCDYLIVLYHGGKEYYRYPSPKLQKVFRKFSEKGANLVIAQHTHCIGCYEYYNDSLLLYGQGNFHFTKYHNEYWDNSLLVELELEKNTKPKISFLPLIVNGTCVSIASKNQANDILSAFNQRSDEILNDDFVKNKFVEYCKSHGAAYAKVIRGETSIIKRLLLKINKKSFDYHYRKKRIYSLLNYIECEAHREIVINEIKRVIAKENHDI